MQIEDYFDFLAPNDIRLKGHRIGIESILCEYIHNSKSPEQIAHRFPTLSLEQIYATILYYLQNKKRLDHYLAEWLEHGERMRQKQAKNPTSTMLKLRRLRAKKEAERQKAEAA